MRLVNVGCGNRIHPEWCNLDLVARDPAVTEHDLRRGIPFEADSCDAVYHSHVLEHLTAEDGLALLRECGRVLRPGGIIRVVVPDLERIAEDYLLAMEEAEIAPEAMPKVDWMKLELIDQMVRVRSGGEMVRFVQESGKEHHEFIRARLGDEVFGSAPSTRKRRTWIEQLRRTPRLIGKARRLLTLAVLTLLEGNAGRRAFQEGMFRQSGEIHRWMYDRLTLRAALEAAGFDDVSVCSAASSRIPHYARYELDAGGDQVWKPDSLFMEAIKAGAESPSVSSHSRSAADRTTRRAG